MQFVIHLLESPIDVSAELSGDEILIKVADHGPGIPEDDYERIFDKFYRVLNTKDSHSTSPPGSGLGLAVCKGLVEAHKGKIQPTHDQGEASFSLLCSQLAHLKEVWHEQTGCLYSHCR